jgi:nitrite reductase/ring-hydroxylating ferredoxin subunit
MILPPPGTLLGEVEGIPDPGGIIANWAEAPIILACREGVVRAYLNICPHAGRPLNLPNGKVFAHGGDTLICPAHGAVFDILSGACAGGPAGSSGLTPVSVDVRGGKIYAV